jgi:hypothetical protein
MTYASSLMLGAMYDWMAEYFEEDKDGDNLAPAS